MYWEIHDSGEPDDKDNTLWFGIKNVACDYDYQLEQKVIDIWADYPECVEIRCFYEKGERGGKGTPFRTIKRGEKW